MGCSTSRIRKDEKKKDNSQASASQNKLMGPSLQKLLTSKNPQDLLKAFILLDKSILEEESQSPSSVLGQAMSRRELIKSHLQSAIQSKSQNEILSEECSMYEIFVDLGLVRNLKIAGEHEEFIASINRKAMNQSTINILQKSLAGVEDQIKKSSEKISQLQSAYHQQDELLGQIFEETHGSDTEKQLEKEIDTMRYYRDVLSTGVLQWEVAANDVQTAAHLFQKGLSFWKSLKNQPLEKKIFLSTMARDALHEGALLIQSAEELLQGVQFPYCTTRELKGVSQATDYAFTDILIEDRYLHATEVYKNFLQRATSLHEWIKQVLNSKLKKDLFEIEEKILDLARQLTSERIYLILKKLNLENPPEAILEDLVPDNVQQSIVKSYNDRKLKVVIGTSPRQNPDQDETSINLESQLGLDNSQDSDVKNYFRKILENRKKTMWPSRRIDELQTLMVQK